MLKIIPAQAVTKSSLHCRLRDSNVIQPVKNLPPAIAKGSSLEDIPETQPNLEKQAG